MDYARQEGKAKPLAQTMGNGEFAIATASALSVAVAVAALGLLTTAAVCSSAIAAIFGTLWLARMFERRIGGYTGDCLGAVQQVTEVMIYVCVLASLGHGALRF
jgi:adenosylcobinamide-GDP ribazoletransferase